MFYLSSSKNLENRSNSTRFNEPLPYVRKKSRLAIKSNLINPSYMLYKTEPTKNYNSISILSSARSNF